MKKIVIKITDEELYRLKNKAKYITKVNCSEFNMQYNVTPEKIIEQFVSDLTSSDRNGGSDERAMANNWLERSIYNF